MEEDFFKEEKVNHHTERTWLMAVLGLIFPIFASAQQPVEKDWNFLVFINGVNNLDYYGAMNINQMEEVGSNEKLNILVQWGSLARPSVDRLHVQKDSNTSRVTSPIVQTLGTVDMGDWRELVNFAKWAHDYYPAKRTFLVVWNHGNGWHRPDSIGFKDISWDDRTGNSITTEQLGQAMREISAHSGRPVDIYGSDACLMAMAEVADEMNGAVDVFLGSQDLEPGEGWPYNTFLRAWEEDLTRSPLEVAKLLSTHFLAAYSEDGIYRPADATMSVLDMKELPGFRSAVHQLVIEMRTLSESQLTTVKLAASRSQNYFNADYRDLIDFLDRMQAGGLALSSDRAVRDAHRKFVVANDQNLNSMTHGLSIWLPTLPGEYEYYRERYLSLSFHQHTSWVEVATIVGKR